MRSTDRRIQRLLRWYPRAWRENRGAEFAALLEDSMAERRFWPRRWLNIAIEGSRLRISDFRGRVSTQKEPGMSLRSLWFAVSLALFVGYSIAFVTLGSTAYAHGFEDATVPLSIIVGTMVILLGVLTLTLGLKAAVQTRSTRASWPSLVLGSALIAAVGCDWWISDLGGWSAISHSFVSLDPFAWQYAFTSAPPVRRSSSAEQLYLVVNLGLLLMIATSGTAIIHRLSPSVRTRHSARPAKVIVIMGMAAVVSAAWVWVIYSTGQVQAPFFIASSLTVAAASTSLAFLSRKGSLVTLS